MKVIEEEDLKLYINFQGLQVATLPDLVAFPKHLKCGGRDNPIAGNDHFAGFDQSIVSTLLAYFYCFRLVALEHSTSKM